MGRASTRVLCESWMHNAPSKVLPEGGNPKPVMQDQGPSSYITLYIN